MLAAGVAPSVCRAGSLMRVAPHNIAGPRWTLSVGGVLLADGELSFERLPIRVWTAVDVSWVDAPTDPSCWMQGAFDRPIAVPHGGVVSIEFDVNYSDQLGQKRRTVGH